MLYDVGINLEIARNPTVTIVYGDYYGATLEITRSPQKHGRLGATWFHSWYHVNFLLGVN